MPKCSIAADAATCGLIDKIVVTLLNPLFALLTAVAVLLFVWGAVGFLMKIRKGETAKDEKKHMGFGLLGLFIIVSTMAIINVISNTVKGLFQQ